MFYVYEYVSVYEYIRVHLNIFEYLEDYIFCNLFQKVKLS